MARIGCEGPGPAKGPGPFHRCSPHERFHLVGRLRPVDQPELVRSVIWLDSAGRPAYGRGGGPGREGRLSSQSPRGSPAVYASRTTSFLPCRPSCGRTLHMARMPRPEDRGRAIPRTSPPCPDGEAGLGSTRGDTREPRPSSRGAGPRVRRSRLVAPRRGSRGTLHRVGVLSGPGLRLWLDHASVAVPELAAAVEHLDRRLGLHATVSPAAPERHSRVYLDRSYLEFSVHPTGSGWEATMFFLRFSEPVALRAHLDAAGIAYGFE